LELGFLRVGLRDPCTPAATSASRKKGCFDAPCVLFAILAGFFALPAVDRSQAETRRERTVNVYNWTDYIAPDVIEDFTKATGVKVRYDTFDSNDTLETKLLAGRSGYDVVVPTAYFLERQIKAGVFQKLDKSKLPNLANLWPRSAVASPSTTRQPVCRQLHVGHDRDRLQRQEGARDSRADGKIDSWDMAFKPEALARFKDCGVHMLDSSDDILAAALHYLGLDPNTTKEVDYQKART